MRFYKDCTKNKKFSLPAFILAFAAAIFTMLYFAGCGSAVILANACGTMEYVYESDANGDAGGLPSVEITADTIIDTGYGQNLPSVLIPPGTSVRQKGYRVFRFREDAYAGAGLDGSNLPFALYYGFHARFEEDGTMTYRAYSYLEDVVPVRADITRISTGKTVRLPDASLTEDKEINLSRQSNDLFKITVSFSNDITVTMPVYVNDGRGYEVSISSKSEEKVQKYLEKPGQIRALAESFGVTPEKSLSVDSEDIAYPVTGRGENYRCDTELWRALAHDIVPDDTLPDSVKVVMLHDWMTANLAYDHYKVDVLGVSRAKYYQNYSGTWSVYNTHTGVCADFVNIYAIMCRELGVPCGSLDSDKLNHTWAIVYLDGEWWEVELTRDIRRDVYGEDVTDVSNADDTVCYFDFLPYGATHDLKDVSGVNGCITCASYRRTGEHHDCIHTRQQ